MFMFITRAAHATQSRQDNQSRLDQILQNSLKQYSHQENIQSGNNDQLRNENKNQDVVNTIVNHNNRIKNVENKMNLIINHFAKFVERVFANCTTSRDRHESLDLR